MKFIPICIFFFFILVTTVLWKKKIIHLCMHCLVQWDIFGAINMLVFRKLEKMEENIKVLRNAGTLACFQFQTNLMEKQTIHVNQYSYLLYK